MGTKLQPVRMTVDKAPVLVEGAPFCVKTHAASAAGGGSSLAS